MVRLLFHRTNLALFPGGYEPNFPIDDALSMQANYRSYRQPENHIFNLLKKWWNSNHGRGSALRVGLDFHAEGKKRQKDLASIAALEKTWTHRFIDRSDRLRRFFAKASTFSTPPTAS